MASALVFVLIGRQYLTTRQNQRLTTALTQQEAQLRHQAFHDGLTGLANRAPVPQPARTRRGPPRARSAPRSHGPVPRPRRLQGRQRHARPRRRRRLLVRTWPSGCAPRRARATPSPASAATSSRSSCEDASPTRGSADHITDVSAAVRPVEAPVAVAVSIGWSSWPADEPPTRGCCARRRRDVRRQAISRAGIALYHPGMTRWCREPRLLAETAHRERPRRDPLAYQPTSSWRDGRSWRSEALARWHRGMRRRPSRRPHRRRLRDGRPARSQVLRCSLQACAQIAEWLCASLGRCTSRGLLRSSPTPAPRRQSRASSQATAARGQLVLRDHRVRPSLAETTERAVRSRVSGAARATGCAHRPRRLRRSGYSSLSRSCTRSSSTR